MANKEHQIYGETDSPNPEAPPTRPYLACKFHPLIIAPCPQVMRKVIHSRRKAAKTQKHRPNNTQTKPQISQNTHSSFFCLSFCVLCFVWIFWHCVLCFSYTVLCSLRNYFMLPISRLFYRSAIAHDGSSGNSMECPRLAVLAGGRPILSKTVLCG